MGSYSHLTAAERDRLADSRADGQSVRAIAQALRRSPATISRELRRNALASGAYRPTIAEGRICSGGSGRRCSSAIRRLPAT